MHISILFIRLQCIHAEDKHIIYSEKYVELMVMKRGKCKADRLMTSESCLVVY